MEYIFYSYIRYVNFNVYYIYYILGKCVQSYTSVKSVLLGAIPTVIRTYYYDQYYGSAVFLLKTTYLYSYILQQYIYIIRNRKNVQVRVDISTASSRNLNNYLVFPFLINCILSIESDVIAMLTPEANNDQASPGQRELFAFEGVS